MAVVAESSKMVLVKLPPAPAFTASGTRVPSGAISVTVRSVVRAWAILNWTLRSPIKKSSRIARLDVVVALSSSALSSSGDVKRFGPFSSPSGPSMRMMLAGVTLAGSIFRSNVTSRLLTVRLRARLSPVVPLMSDQPTRVPVLTAVVSSIFSVRSEEHTSELQSRQYLVCRLLLEKKKKNNKYIKSDELRHSENQKWIIKIVVKS